MTEISILCAWCGAIKHDAGPGSAVSSGMCDSCAENYSLELTALASGGQPGEKPAVAVQEEDGE